MATEPAAQLPGEPPHAADRRATAPRESLKSSVRHARHTTSSPPAATPCQRPFPSSLPTAGPSGVGKTASVRALAADLGFEIVEWTSPVPMLFEEHQHARGADWSLEYQSKVSGESGVVEFCSDSPSARRYSSRLCRLAITQRVLWPMFAPQSPARCRAEVPCLEKSAEEC